MSESIGVCDKHEVHFDKECSICLQSAKIEELEKELAKWKEQNQWNFDEHKRQAKKILVLAERNESLESRLALGKEAFDKYARHFGECKIFNMVGCSCGLNSTIDTLAKIEGSKTEGVMEPLEFSYDKVNDILTIEGVRYAGSLFRDWGGIHPTPNNEWLKIVSREDGVLVMSVTKGKLIAPHTKIEGQEK